MSPLQALSLLAMMTFVPGTFAQLPPLPGLDPTQTDGISASVLGVGSDEQTTYLVFPVTTSSGYEDAGIYGSATVIAGSTGVELIYNDANLGISENEKCGISKDGSSEVIDCTAVVVVSGSSNTMLLTTTVAAPSGGSTPIVTTSPLATSQTASVPTITSGSSLASQTASSGVPAPSNTTNDATTFRISATAAWLAGAGAASFLFL